MSIPIHFNSLKENTVICQRPIAKAQNKLLLYFTLLTLYAIPEQILSKVIVKVFCC